MKKVLFSIGTIIVASLVFVAGSFASQWLSYTGVEQSASSKDNVEEIMQILRDVNEDKITAEKALSEIKKIDTSGMENQINDLKNQLSNKTKEVDNKHQEILNKQKEIEQKQQELNSKQDELNTVAKERDKYMQQVDTNNQYLKHLEAELTKANDNAADVNANTSKAVEEARSYK